MKTAAAPSEAELEAFAGVVDTAVRNALTDHLLPALTGPWKVAHQEVVSAALAGANGAVCAAYLQLADPRQPLSKVRDTLVSGVDEFFSQEADRRRGGSLQ